VKASRFSDAQKAFILKQGRDGIPVADICRKTGIIKKRSRIDGGTTTKNARMGDRAKAPGRDGRCSNKIIPSQISLDWCSRQADEIELIGSEWQSA
jgi:hypothetical protein